MHGNKPVFGVSAKNWAYVEAVSAVLLLATTGRRAANEIGSKGVFGHCKSDKLAKIGSKHKDRWETFETLSLVAFALVLLKSNEETFEGIKKTILVSNTDSTNLF